VQPPIRLAKAFLPSRLRRAETDSTSTAGDVLVQMFAPGPGDRMPTGRDLGVRSAVVAPNAAAATAHPLATQTALDVMKRGGSAVDAAIAANAMLGLVEPTGNGIGGDLFAIVWDPETQQLYGYNGSGRSAKNATLEQMQAKADEFMDGKEIPPFGAAPVTVPGTVDGWFALHDRFGKLPINTDLEARDPLRPRRCADPGSDFLLLELRSEALRACL
jgi:gamma-glutamyltranspeptidase/glutathione hydrolase